MARIIGTTFMILAAMGMISALGTSSALGEPSVRAASTGSVNHESSLDTSLEMERELKSLKNDAHKSVEHSLYGMAKERFRQIADVLDADMLRLEIVMLEASSEEMRDKADALWQERREMQKQTFDMLKLLALR
jgi:hypothetical protein